MISSEIAKSPLSWDEIKVLFPVDSHVEGTVEAVHRYGVFFEIGQPFPAFLDVGLAPEYEPHPGDLAVLQVIQHVDRNRQLRVKLAKQHVEPGLPPRINVDSAIVLRLATLYFQSLGRESRRTILNDLREAVSEKYVCQSSNTFPVGNPIIALLAAGVPAAWILKSIQPETAGIQ